MADLNISRHSFTVEFAKRYGYPECVLIDSIDYWITHNKANNSHFVNGRTWTYNSAQAYTRLFPYLTAKKIKYALLNLFKKGVLLKEQFRKKEYDHSNWYTFTDQFLKEYDAILRCCNKDLALSGQEETQEEKPENAPKIRLDKKGQSLVQECPITCPDSANLYNSLSFSGSIPNSPQTPRSPIHSSGSESFNHQESGKASKVIRSSGKKSQQKTFQQLQQHQRKTSAKTQKASIAPHTVSADEQSFQESVDSTSLSLVGKSSQQKHGDARKARSFRQSSPPYSPPAPCRYPTKTDAMSCVNHTITGTMFGKILNHLSALSIKTLAFILFQQQIGLEELFKAIYHGKFCWKSKRGDLKRMDSWLLSEKPWAGSPKVFAQENDSDANWSEFQHLPDVLPWFFALPEAEQRQIAPADQTSNPAWWLTPGVVSGLYQMQQQ